tara:strand:+ start:470 stop:718 length:249 start_codon:yes stop_codon:yes gene_type:complete
MVINGLNSREFYRRENQMSLFSSKQKDSTGLTVQEIIAGKDGQFSTVSKGATVQECAKVTTFMKLGVLVVLNDDGKFAGMVS